MSAETQEFNLKLSASGTPGPAGSFEILAITAGSGNGWHFTPECLRASLPLWDGAHTFIDHSWSGRSVKDLAGACASPRWDEETRGVLLTLRPLGPAAPVLAELGRQLLGSTPQSPSAPRLGFSADIVFTAEGKDVRAILRVNSVDLVIDPARGGMFKRALNSTRKEPPMPEIETFSPATVSEAQPPAGSAPETAQTLHLQQCQYLLDSGLNSSRLPAPLAERVRRQFAGRAFTPAELTAAIDDSRQMLSDLTAPQTVRGPAISSMFNSTDQITAAVEDMFEVPRSAGLEAVKPARLSGIRELYMTLTGDYDLHGGYHAGRVTLATSADFSGLVKNAMNKVIANEWEMLGRAGYDWWTRVTRQEHFSSLNDVTGILVGTVGDLPAVAEGAEYTELVVGDSPETASFVKYGGYIPLTLELIDRDQTRKLKAYPRELASAGLRKISSLVAAVFTANSGVGPALADTGALFNASAVSGKGGHANLLTGALSAAQWEAASTAIYNQPMLVKNAAGLYGSGPRMAINPRYLLVPRALQLSAMKILYPTLENAASIYSENMQRGQPGDVVTVPDWADANDWAAVCDPRVAPAIFVGERFGILPQVFIAGDELSPAVFMNDESRLKVRHFLAVWVNDFRPLHKSNVAA
jgi:hypothetical protein